MKTGELGPFWSRSGVMFVKASAATIGPSESLPAIKKLGYRWCAYDPTTGEWTDERKLCALHGLDVVTWTRVRNMTDLHNLVTAAKRWKAKAIIPNLEIDDTRNQALMETVLYEMSRYGKALVVTDGWADPIGCWHGYRQWVGSPECFPQANPAYWDVTGCCLHAGAFFRAVLPCLGAYVLPSGTLPVRRDYQHAGPVVVYPGDSVADWARWPA